MVFGWLDDDDAAPLSRRMTRVMMMAVMTMEVTMMGVATTRLMPNIVVAWFRRPRRLFRIFYGLKIKKESIKT
jgi:hypothetical protein